MTSRRFNFSPRKATFSPGCVNYRPHQAAGATPVALDGPGVFQGRLLQSVRYVDAWYVSRASEYNRVLVGGDFNKSVPR